MKIFLFIPLILIVLVTGLVSVMWVKEMEIILLYNHLPMEKCTVWIEPLNGYSQGDYEPVVLLVTPKKKQVISLGGNTALTPYTSAFGEVSTDK